MPRTGHSPRFVLKKVKCRSSCVIPTMPNPTTSHNLSLSSLLSAWMDLWSGGKKTKLTGSFGRLEATESALGVGSAGSMCRAVVEVVALETDFLGLNSSSPSVPVSLPTGSERRKRAAAASHTRRRAAAPGPPALTSPWPACVCAPPCWTASS